MHAFAKAVLYLFILLLMIVTFTRVAYAEEQRFLIHESWGWFFEPQDIDRPCGEATKKRISRLMDDGGLLLWLDEKAGTMAIPRGPADSNGQDKHGNYVSIWRYERYTLVITLFPVIKRKKAKPALVRRVWLTMILEADKEKRNEVTCYERFDGVVEVNR